MKAPQRRDRTGMRKNGPFAADRRVPLKAGLRPPVAPMDAWMPPLLLAPLRAATQDAPPAPVTVAGAARPVALVATTLQPMSTDPPLRQTPHGIAVATRRAGG